MLVITSGQMQIKYLIAVRVRESVSQLLSEKGEERERERERKVYSKFAKLYSILS